MEDQTKDDAIKQKLLKEAFFSLNLKSHERLLLTCLKCHGLKPMIIVEIGHSDHCKLCGTSGKFVLLHETQQQTDSDQTMFEYTVIREHITSSVEGHCKFYQGQQWNTCPDGEGCLYAHSAIERKIWVMCKKYSVNWASFIEAIGHHLLQNDTATAWFHCPICSVNLETGIEFSAHCDSKNHKKLSKTITDRQTTWRYRDPPDLSVVQSFALCSWEKDCDQGEQCPRAHSKDELEEWKKRRALLQKKLKISKDNTLMPFGEKIKKEYEETDLPASVLVDHIDGVKWTVTPSSTDQQCMRRTEKKWLIKLECDNPQNKLNHVAFMQRSGQDCFKVSCLRGKRASDFTSHIDFTAATDDTNNFSQGKAKLKVKFSSPYCGSFHDHLVIEFRDSPRPALMIKFDVEVTLTNSINWESIATSKSSKKPSDNWQKMRRIVRYPENFSTKFDETLAKLSVEYKTPEVALDYHQAADDGSVSNFQFRELNAENYVSKMHKFLYQEETARSSAMAKLHSNCDIKISDHFSTDSTGLHYGGRKGHLFGEFEPPKHLTRDSEEGMLVLENCRKVLLSLHSRGPTDEVYEAEIEEQNAEQVVLNISAQCVENWQLKSGMLIQCEVRYLLDRHALCMCHCALDLLGDRVSMLCPDQLSDFSSKNQNIERLDSNQMKAFQHMTRENPPVPLFTLLGPFGTGKTHAIGVCVKHLLEKVADVKILICTHSNSAADLYIEKNFEDPSWNGKIIRVYYHNRKIHTVSPYAVDLWNSCGVKFLAQGTRPPLEIKKHCLFHEGKFRYPEMKEVLSENVKVVIATFSTALALGQKGTGLQGTFTHVFLDEGAQAMEAEVIIPLTLALNKKTKVIVAGDHMQISPKIYCKKSGSMEKFTLVERMYDLYEKFKATRAYQGNQLCVFLRNNYRCVKPILELTEEMFYKKGMLTFCSKEIELPGVDPIQYFHVQGNCEKDVASGGFFNKLEAEIIVAHVMNLVKKYSVQEKEIAIVATYAVQVKLIREHLKKLKLREVDVERARNIQGREYKIVILSCVHRRVSRDDTAGSNSGFLADVGLLNTAITRSKVAVIAVGDAVTLCSLGKCQNRWNLFLKTCCRRSTVLPNNKCYPEIRRQIAGMSALDPGSQEFVPKGVPRVKPPSFPQKKAIEANLPLESDDYDDDDQSTITSSADGFEADSEYDSEDLVDDGILNAILEEEFGAKQDTLRVNVDETGLEYLESEDINRPYREPKIVQYTKRQLQRLLRNEPNTHKRCILNVKWWHTAEAILVQPEEGLTKVLLQTKKSIGQAFDKDEVVVKIELRSRDPAVPTTGRVLGILSRYRGKDPRTREFVCIPDKFNPSEQMCPIDQKTTKFYLFNLRGHSKDTIAIFKYSSEDRKLKIQKEEPIDQYTVQGYGKLFVVRFLCWNKHCSSPLGYVCDVIDSSEAEKYYTITYDVPPQHTSAMEQEAESLTDPNSRIREDCTRLFAFTINKPDAYDLNAAISIEKCSRKKHSNCYQVVMHIADVASVLPLNSKIDKEAKKRGTTFYVPDIAGNETRKNSDMLPHTLSSEKCSLVPGQTRPTISMFFHTSNPPAIGTNQEESNIPTPRLTTICSRHRFSYREAKDFLDEAKRSPVKDFDEAKDETMPQQIYQIWQFVLQLRHARLGTAIFYDEPYFEKYRDFCDEGLIHMLVQEAMITVNACSAIFMKNKHCDFLLRCQNRPDANDVDLWKQRYWDQIKLSLRQQFLLQCLKPTQISAPEVPTQEQLVEIHSHVWSDIGKAVESGDLESALLLFCCDSLQPSLLPAARGFMKIQQKAALKPFNATNGEDSFGHFLLRIPFYSWCSSPIHRYPDITSQRAIINKIKNMKANGSSSVVVRESRKERQKLKNMCESLSQRQNDADDYERGMIGFSLAVKLQDQQERSYQQANITEVTSREISFTNVDLLDLQHVLMPLRYGDLSAKKSKPEIDEKALRVQDLNILKENNLTWHLRYYVVDDHSSYKTPEACEVFGVSSAKWLELVSALKGFWESNAALNEKQFSCAAQGLKETFRSRQIVGRCPRKQSNHIGPCNRKECDVATNKNSTCTDFMSFKTKNGIKHGRVITVKMKPGATIQVQLHPTIYRGLMRPSVQLLQIAEDLDICVEHQRDPVETFAADAKPTSQLEEYETLQDYADTWLPVLRLEGIHSAVGNQSSTTLVGVKIKWSQSKKSGSFFIDRRFCNDRLIEIIPNDFLCIRVHGAPLKKEGRRYTWVSHAVVVMSDDPDEQHMESQYETGRQSWRKDAADPHKVSFEICQPIPPFERSTPPDDIAGMQATVECIELSIPHRRMAQTLLEIRRKDMPNIVKSLCLGVNLVAQITETGKLAALEAVLKTVGIKPVGGFPHRLNAGQKEQVKRAMTNEITLIQGPPGTGKSYLGAYLVYYFQQVNQKTAADNVCNEKKKKTKTKKILYCGPSNKSVDVVAGHLKRCKLSVVRVHGKVAEELTYPNPLKPKLGNRRQEAPDKHLKDLALHEKIRRSPNTRYEKILEFDERFHNARSDRASGCEGASRLLGRQKMMARRERSSGPVTLTDYKTYVDLVDEAKREELGRHDIILCTCTAARGYLLKKLFYSHCIIDEAAMCSEPETMIPVVMSRAEQVVLIGDHKQLQPVILCDKAKELGLKYSKFERLKEHAGMLTEQYRMDRFICDFPSKQFYEGKLGTNQSVLQRMRLEPGVLRYPARSNNTAIFVNVDGKEDSSKFDQGGENSKYNLDEARAVFDILHWLHFKKRVEVHNIMILSPYLAQCDKIKHKIKNEKIRSLLAVRIGTVATSQGDEQDYVIFSTVRSRKIDQAEKLVNTRHWKRKYLGFVDDPHVINVAITRAKKGLCIVGNKQLLEKDMVTWKKLLEHYERQGSIVDFKATDAPWNAGKFHPDTMPKISSDSGISSDDRFRGQHLPAVSSIEESENQSDHTIMFGNKKQVSRGTEIRSKTLNYDTSQLGVLVEKVPDNQSKTRKFRPNAMPKVSSDSGISSDDRFRGQHLPADSSIEESENQSDHANTFGNKKQVSRGTEIRSKTLNYDTSQLGVLVEKVPDNQSKTRKLMPFAPQLYSDSGISCDEVLAQQLKNQPSNDETMNEHEDMSVPSDTIVNETSSVIGPNGGVIEGGGCLLKIPKGALDSEVTIKLKSTYGGNNSMEGLVTALLKCEPNGQKFNKGILVRLYTCYVTDERAVVQVRRSEDGMSWENIKQLYHTHERFFEFSVKGFSWYTAIMDPIMKWWRSEMRKSLTYWIPLRTHPDFAKVLRCFVDDDVPDVKRKPSNFEEDWELPFFVKQTDERVVIKLKAESIKHSREIEIVPQSRSVKIHRRPHNETSFELNWTATTYPFYAMHVTVQTNGVQTNEDEFDQSFSVARPRPDLLSSENRQPIQSQDAAPRQVINIGRMENSAIGDRSAAYVSPRDPASSSSQPTTQPSPGEGSISLGEASFSGIDHRHRASESAQLTPPSKYDVLDDEGNAT